MEKGKAPMAKSVLRACALGIAVYLLLLALCAYLTLAGRLGEDRMTSAARVCAAAAAFALTAFSVRHGKGSGLLTPLLAAALFALTLPLVGTLLYHELRPAAMLPLLLAIVLGTLPALALRRRGGRRGRRRTAPRSRRST